MKRLASIGLSIITICSCFAGCAKCIKTETIVEQVEIIDTDHRGAWVQVVPCGKVSSTIIYPEVYQVVVSYNDMEYRVNGKEIYDKYKHRIGEITNATIEKNSYDDGTIKYSVLALE